MKNVNNENSELPRSLLRELERNGVVHVVKLVSKVGSKWILVSNGRMWVAEEGHSGVEYHWRVKEYSVMESQIERVMGA